MNKSVFKQTLHDYETDRDKARVIYERRRTEIYNRLPRVREIDEQLTRMSLEATRGVLSGAEQDLAGLRQRINELVEEKQALVVRGGFSEDYLTNIHTCALCKDTGFVGTQKCRCLHQRLIDRYYELSGVTQSSENFQTFEFGYYSGVTDPSTGISPLANIRTIYNHCVNFVVGFGTTFSNLLFYGDTGLGKTFLCNCIAKDLLDAGVTVLYVTAPRLFKRIEELRFNRNEMDAPDMQLEIVFSAELLIIDDLGSEFSTVVTDTELFNIVNSRLLDRRPTIISTNLSLTDFQNSYTDRIISRFTGNYKMLRLFGEDIRVKKKLDAYM